jgi:sterol desaturase/sphingolipid hydroxylase (fatty acid hydroxylase superfamily)
MGAAAFVANVTTIFVLMALLGLVEAALPLAGLPADRRRHGAVNVRLTLLTFAVTGAVTAAAAALTLALAIHSSEGMVRLGLPFAVQLVIGVAVLDFGYGYAAHRAMHWSPLLWRVHRVHHSDTFVDVTTSFRTHPLESLWRSGFVAVPVWLLGIPPEAVALHRLLSTINALFEHANIRVPAALDRLLSWIWVTPDLHKRHHSRDRRETDTNYGNLFSIFDRWLATFTPAAPTPPVYGVDDAAEATCTKLAGLLRAPFVGRRTAVSFRPARTV